MPPHTDFREGCMQLLFQAKKTRTLALNQIDAKLSDVVPRQAQLNVPSVPRVSALPPSRKRTTSAVERTGDDTGHKKSHLRLFATLVQQAGNHCAFSSEIEERTTRGAVPDWISAFTTATGSRFQIDSQRFKHWLSSQRTMLVDVIEPPALTLRGFLREAAARGPTHAHALCAQLCLAPCTPKQYA